MWEILTQQLPWSDFKYSGPVSLKLLDKLERGERPPVDQHYSSSASTDQYVALMQRCWDNNPRRRPLFKDIVKDSCFRSLLVSGENEEEEEKETEKEKKRKDDVADDNDDGLGSGAALAGVGSGVR